MEEKNKLKWLELFAETRGIGKEAVLWNLILDLVKQTDEDFADEMVGIVMGNDRFDLD